MYLISAVLGFVFAGCANLTSNEIHVGEAEKANPNAVKVSYPVSVRIAGYVDGRGVGNPRKIGVAEGRVLGMTGSELILDRDVTDVVDALLRRRLEDAGLQVLPKDDATALFEVSGVIKELKYDVKARDKVSIKLETTLKEASTGKVVWAGEVEEKNERFAGVSGNTKGDIADYLKKEVMVATGKTAEAISSALAAAHPELFNAAASTKAIPGVNVFVTPGVSSPEGTNTGVLIPPNGGEGRLVVRTMPSGAKVYLDGVYYGMSPLSVQTAAGIRTVEVKLKGYQTASEKVAIRIKETTELEVQMEK
jgi:hypothetical protein